MNKSYKLILSIRDTYSFLAGMIVSGFVVEISMNTDNNKFHWFTIFLGLLIGICCFILVKICENFNDNLKNVMNDEDAWDSINKNYSTNKIFKLLPKFWIPVLPIVIVILLCLGVFLLNMGNHYNSELELLSKAKEKKVLIQTLDSLYETRIHFFNKEIIMLQDSINMEREINVNNRKIIDSLIYKMNAKRPKM